MKYKVGDKVRVKSLDWYNENKNPDYGFVYLGNGICFYSHMSTYCGKTMTISEVVGCCYRMAKCAYDDWTDEMIEGLAKEETNLEPKFHIGNRVYSTTLQHDVIMEILPNCFYKVGDTRGLGWFKTHEDSLCKDAVKLADEYTLPEGYIFKDENGNVINASKIVLEKKKKEYPKTFLGCCDVLNIGNLIERGVKGYKTELFDTLQKLYICRDAYWKIAGEEMGLGKPWKPDWNDKKQDKHGFYNEIKNTIINSKVFVFPTAKMRDVFYENFKELIEKCKELL